MAVLLHVLDDETECYEVVTGVIQADNAGGAGSFLDQSHAALATSQFSFGELARKKAVSEAIAVYSSSSLYEKNFIAVCLICVLVSLADDVVACFTNW